MIYSETYSLGALNVEKSKQFTFYTSIKRHIN